MEVTMGFALNIKDETSSGELINEQVIQFPVDEISVQTLIEQRVLTEVERYNNDLASRFMGLIQPSNMESSLNNKKIKQHTKIDGQKQKDVAISAFKK